MEIITICGSYKFQKEMKEMAEIFELQGNCVLTPIDLTKQKEFYTVEDFSVLGEMHKEKIKLCDTVLVINVNDYIGESTRSEIEFAKKLNKKVIYYTDIINFENNN